MQNEPLGIGLGPSPMPGGGGLTMEHGKHSAPIGVLNPFQENVSPHERESSTDWSEDTPSGIREDNFFANGSMDDHDEDDRANDRGASENAEELAAPGRTSGIEGGEGISRLSNTTYGPRTEAPYEC